MKLQSQRTQKIIIPFLVSVAASQSDPLINQGAEKVVYVGIFLIAVVLTIAIWKLSPRVEHAIIFAFVVSIALIAFFLSR